MYNREHQSIEYNPHTWLLSIQPLLISDDHLTCIRFMGIFITSAVKPKHFHRAGSGCLKAIKPFTPIPGYYRERCEKVSFTGRFTQLLDCGIETDSPSAFSKVPYSYES